MLNRDPTAILEALARLSSQDEPTLCLMLAKYPELSQMDWINRWGPHHAWPPILSRFSTSQLAYLAKAITVLERDLEWLGGSVAATIWIFRAYQARDDGDAEALAAWILSNRRNPWSPFGTQSYARTLSEYRHERERHRQRQLAHLEREAAQRLRKHEDKHLAQERAGVRCAEGEERAAKVRAYVMNLEAMSVLDRLVFLACDETFPLEVIPRNLIALSLPQVPLLTAEARAAFLLRIDRRKARRWRRLRRALAG
jgi:hypothetical protein